MSYLEEVLRRLRVEPDRIRSDLIGRSLYTGLVRITRDKYVDLSNRLVDSGRIGYDRSLKIVNSCHDYLPLLDQLVKQSKQAPKCAPAPTTLKHSEHAHAF